MRATSRPSHCVNLRETGESLLVSTKRVEGLQRLGEQQTTKAEDKGVNKQFITPIVTVTLILISHFQSNAENWMQ